MHAATKHLHHDRIDAAAVVATVRSVLRATATPIALHEPEFRGNERAYVLDCIDTGWVSTAGKYVDRFEAMLAEYTGAAHAVAAVNGTAALHICLLLVGVERGDEVLVPTLTFIATANAVSYLGAVPHFVDSEPRTLGIDAQRLSAYLEEIAELRGGVCVNRRTGATIRALVPMHTFGHPSELAALVELCSRWRIALVEDAAESLGSLYRGRHTGRFGKVAALSFNGNKVVTTGGGGAILTDDAAVARSAKHLTTTARLPHQWSFIHDRMGYNYRLPNLNAALGCAQLERLPGVIGRKRTLAASYVKAFQGWSNLRVLQEPPGCRSNYWLNALVLEHADTEVRDAVLAALNAAGIMARPVWTLMHRLPMYRECPRMDLAEAISLEARVINLPSSAFLVDAG